MFGDEDALCSSTPATPMEARTIASAQAPLNGADGRTLRARNWRYHTVPRAGLLALHGAMTYSISFTQLGDELAREGYDVTAYDQRGFGEDSSRLPWPRFDPLIADALSVAGQIRERHPMRPLFLLGESMGGGIAALVAATAPAGLIDGVILAAPAVITCPLRRNLARGVSLGLSSFAPEAPMSFERWRGDGLSDVAAVDLLGDHRVHRAASPAMLAGLLDLAVSVGLVVPDITPPTFVLWGSAEDVVPQPCLARLARGIAGACEHEIIPGAPHLVLQARSREAVVRPLCDWITRQLSAQSR